MKKLKKSNSLMDLSKLKPLDKQKNGFELSNVPTKVFLNKRLSMGTKINT